MFWKNINNFPVMMHISAPRLTFLFWRVLASVTSNISNMSKVEVGLEKIKLTFRELHLVQLKFTAAAV